MWTCSSQVLAAWRGGSVTCYSSDRHIDRVVAALVHVRFHGLWVAMREVGDCVEPGAGLVWESKAASEHVIPRLLDGTCADDDRGDGRLFQHPTQGDLRGRTAHFVGYR